MGAAAQRHPRHHQVLNGDAGSGALRLDHCGFGCRCELCSQDTHWLHFIVFVDALHNHKATTTPSPLPGQAALRGESGCSPFKARRVLLRLPLHRRPGGRVLLRIHHRRSGRHTKTGKTHDICACSFSHLRSIPQVVRRAAALGLLEVRVVYTILARTQVTSLRIFLWVFDLYSAGQNVYLPVFCFEGLISEFPKFTYRFPSLRASFSSQVKKNRKPD